ncbi:MAG: CvpA family protein [Lachnospiraceae bacterium]|nr:CvpA family protein [Lachnospiraceae bacterium]
MTGNIVFVFIILAVFISSHTGGKKGLFEMMVPILSILGTLFLLAAVMPQFAERLKEDAAKLSLQEVIIDIIVFVITFFLMRLIFKYLLKLISPVTEFAVIGDINRLLGFVAGFAFGILAVWLVFFFIIFFMGQSNISAELLSMLDESPPLKFLYNNNLLMTAIHLVVFKWG